MQKLRAEPFLWIHVAGIIFFPLWMGLVLMGLSTGDPILPVWLEQLIVLSIGTALVARMQLKRPFYLFSILVVALPPDQLSPERRRILSSFQSFSYRLVPLLVVLVMVFLGRWVYEIAPLFHRLSVLPDVRLLGLGVAVVGFWIANLFIQIPAAAAWVLSSDEYQLQRFSPVEPETLEQEFTLVGRPWPDLLSRWDPAQVSEEQTTEPEAETEIPPETPAPEIDGTNPQTETDPQIESPKQTDAAASPETEAESSPEIAAQSQSLPAQISPSPSPETPAEPESPAESIPEATAIDHNQEPSSPQTPATAETSSEPATAQASPDTVLDLGSDEDQDPQSGAAQPHHTPSPLADASSDPPQDPQT